MFEHAVILLAEDEEDYVLLIKKAFAEAGIRNPLHVVSTGQEAMAYLKGEGKYAARDEYPLPDLLLLDIKLPGYTGLEIIGWVRSQPGLAGLRVVILTSSDELRDVNDAYRLGANSFLLKPYDFDDLVHLSRVINEFWLHMSKCPESFRNPRGPAQRENSKSDETFERKSEAEPAADVASGALILIVEDNPLNAELATDLLQAKGFRVHSAETARAGIKLARELSPDLILMDFNLPDMDGVDAAKFLRTDPVTRHLRIVGLTAHANGSELAGLDAGFEGFLTKPIDTHTFAESVKSFVAARANKL